ncbi:Hypothetical predicted protein, partial [Paramuricea clavata]
LRGNRELDASVIQLLQECLIASLSYLRIFLFWINISYATPPKALVNALYVDQNRAGFLEKLPVIAGKQNRSGNTSLHGRRSILRRAFVRCATSNDTPHPI